MDAVGGTNEGTLEAESEASLVKSLRDRGLIVISVREQRRRLPVIKKARRKVKLDDTVIFSRQLATMVDAGLPLVQSLNILGEQIENQTFKQIIKDVERDVETGSTLSDSLAKHPKVFSKLFVNMVQAGEASGTLDEILDRLATYLEDAIALRRKVRTALVYPAIITGVAVLLIFFMMIVVIPKFEEIFSGFEVTMPKATQVLINLSKAITSKKFYIPVLTFLLVGLFLFRHYLRTEGGRRRFDSLLLHLPIFGSILRKVAISKFSRTLSTLLKSGVAILGSLEIVGKTSGNKVIEEAVDGVRSSIREGESIASPLAKSGVFPPMVVRMIGVGEQTGALEQMISKISDFYDDQVNTAVSGLTSMIEPIVIVLLGTIVGGIVIAMILPIFKLGEIIKF